MEENYSKFLSFEYENLSPSEKYEFFVEVITNSILLNTPKKKVQKKAIHHNPVPWWDEECDKVKRLRRAAYKKWEFSKELEDLISYNKYCAILKKTFKIKKKENFKKFAESINFHRSQSYVWNKCKIFKNKWVKTNSDHCSENLQREGKVENELNKICCPSVSTDLEWIPNCMENDFFDFPFTFLDFNNALSQTNTNSSPGLDGITYKIIKILPLKFKLLLLDIFNNIYSFSDFPISWSKSYVHFIDKPNNKGVRPISMTSCLCKLFEMLIKNRLQWWVEYKNLLQNNQCGFRKGRSCSDNLLNLTLEIEESFSRKEDTYAAFLDVDSAFPSVNSDILLNILSNIGYSYNLIKFAKFLTHERYIYTDLLGDKFRLARKGLGQGGVLSPLFYIIYTKNIKNDIPKSASISLFADDIEIHSKNKNDLELAVESVRKNLYDLGLDLSPKKTVFVHFNNKKIEPGVTSIKIENFRIKSSETVRFLGLIFDYKLSFTHHVKNIQNRASKALNIIKFLCTS